MKIDPIWNTWIPYLSMILSDLASPAEAIFALGQQSFAKAGNRLPLFGIML
jgi:hypothetical protein